jgi:hypothetical protein
MKRNGNATLGPADGVRIILLSGAIFGGPALVARRLAYDAVTRFSPRLLETLSPINCLKDSCPSLYPEFGRIPVDLWSCLTPNPL